MSKLSVAELAESAKEIFEGSNVPFVYAFSDGNMFLPEHKNAAELHKKQAQLTMHEIPNEAYVETAIAGENEDNDDASILSDGDDSALEDDTQGEETKSKKKASKAAKTEETPLV